MFNRWNAIAVSENAISVGETFLQYTSSSALEVKRVRQFDRAVAKKPFGERSGAALATLRQWHFFKHGQWSLIGALWHVVLLVRNTLTGLLLDNPYMFGY